MAGFNLKVTEIHVSENRFMGISHFQGNTFT